MAEPHIVVPQPLRPPRYARLILEPRRRKYGRELEPARPWSKMPRAFPMPTLLYRALDRFVAPRPAAPVANKENTLKDFWHCIMALGAGFGIQIGRKVLLARRPRRSHGT